MKVIKIIDLLNMISKGEEVPKKIKWGDTKYTLYIDEDTKQTYYQDNECRYFFLNIKCLDDLNDEVEIIEENKTKPLTKKDIEALGYACGEIQKCFTNGWTKSLENKPLEEHKIPEKLKIEQDTPNSNFYIRNEYGTKCALTKHSKIIADKINEIIDYLEKIE